MRVCLFEDRNAPDLEPLALTRPAFDLLCGATPLAAKQLRPFPGAEAGLLVRTHLADVTRLDRPGVPVNDDAWLRRAGPLVLVNGRWLPPCPCPPVPETPAVGLTGGEVAWAVVDPATLPDPLPRRIDEAVAACRDALPPHNAGGALVARPWDLVARNADQLRTDFAVQAVPHVGPWPQVGWRPGGAALVGPADQLLIHPSARIDPMVVFDTTAGPVVVEAGAVIQAFSRIEGPCYVGPGTQIVGANVRGGTTFGPQCRIGGEVEASIVQGYSNKYHEGFLGHSYLGAWVNLGAGTHTSDLRNDYGPVQVPQHGTPVPTGSTKVGSFVGDHTKTGLGSLLNTGTSVGAFCHLLPAGRLLPKHVPPFCTTGLGGLIPHPGPEAVLATAATVMARRGGELTPTHVALVRDLFDLTTRQRRQAVREAEQRRLRRSA